MRPLPSSGNDLGLTSDLMLPQRAAVEGPLRIRLTKSNELGGDMS
jgi:hypothetical protein